MKEDGNNKHDVQIIDEHYLIFYIGSETYGTPLLDVREVVEFQTPKFMPNMENHFLGVINVRGSIVGVVDLRTKFNVKFNEKSQGVLLICETAQGALAAVVDKVEAVLSLKRTEIEHQPPVMVRLDQKYLLGVAKSGERLITLIRLNEAVGEMKNIQHVA